MKHSNRDESPTGINRPRLFGLAIATAALACVLAVSSADALAPAVTIEPASEITYTTAKVKGEVDPQGKATDYHFEYITDAKYQVHGDEQQELEVSAGSGTYTLTFSEQTTAAIPFDASAAELEAALDALSTIGGVGGSVSVSGGPGDEAGSSPYTIVFGGTLAETNVSQLSANSAGLAGGAHVAGVQTNVNGRSVGFEGAVSGPSGSTSSIAQVEGTLAGLEPGIEYHLRLVASNADGPAEAVAATFTTPFSAPAVATGSADHVGPSHAQLHGTINANGEATLYWFEYGLQDCEAGPCESVPTTEDSSPPGAAGISEETFLVSQVIAGLEAETAYHFRIVAENAFGTSAGADQTFTTPAAPGPEAACGNEPRREEQHATFLPDCRAYEMVSPPTKNGGNVIPFTGGTFAAADGSAAAFKSLAAFGDVVGTNVSTEYVSLRSTEVSPGGTGWSTHAVTPAQDSSTFGRLFQLLEPGYLNEPAPELEAGIVRPSEPLTEEPYVANVLNLYLRTDLRSPGTGTYELVTLCPRCAEKETALPPAKTYYEEFKARPVPAGLTPDGGHVIFESPLRLTGDTPVGSDAIQLFEFDHGTLRLVDRVPTSGTAVECDDAGGPACKGGPFAIGGFSTRGTIDELGSGQQMPPRTISDGGDGHVRIFFTRPTLAGGVGTEKGQAGLLYLREDGHYTAKINASERAVPDAYAPARFQDASSSGERAFFTTAEALTDDAASGGAAKLYMYDATKPGSDPDNLTLLSGSGNVEGVIGSGAQGHYVYFVATGQVVAGAPPLGGEKGIYLWHDGDVSFVAPLGSGDIRGEMVPANLSAPQEGAPLSRVTPDGRHLLFFSDQQEVVGYDSNGNDEFYLYSAETSSPIEPDVQCVSCRPDGAPAAAPAGNFVADRKGGTRGGAHVSRAISDDGSRVFFNTADPLVAQDTNGFEDAYVYDASTERVHLLSSGTAPEDSWFLDASADGANAFIVTSQPLVGWDRDTAYDLYDVRAGGGFPEPEPVPAPCAGETCQGAQATPPAAAAIGSTVQGAGNPKLTCPKGWKKKRVHGRTRCVKKTKHRKHRRHGRHRKREAARLGGRR